VNQDRFERFQVGLTEVSRLLLPFAIIWLLGSIGLGWLVKSFVILLGLLVLTPILAFVGFRWWLSRNLIQSDCPVCHYEFASLNHSEFNCPNCGEALRAENQKFNRLTPADTIDVSAVEVLADSTDD